VDHVRSEHGPGQPRSERDAAFLKRYNARMQVPIIVSAILPLIVVPESGDWVAVVIGVVTWLVFLVDYVAHARHIERYGRTGVGRFDLFVVIATAPWFLLPGAHPGQFVVLLRLARLARLVMASKGSRRLFDRLGRVTLVAGGVVVIASLVAYHAEHPGQPRVRHGGRRLLVGDRDPHHRRLRGHRPQDPDRALGGGHHNAHRDRRPGPARRVSGELLPAE
jgi:uncharacterized protein YqgC (DUF456 family)